VTLNRVPIWSPNYSSRGGAGVRLIVIHTAEGATTYQSLGQFFKNPSSQVSSHTGIDDTPNTVGEYVQRPSKAWTSANANPVATQTELCAFAKWDSAEWQRHPMMLSNCAQWIAEEAAYFNIPIRRLTATQAQGNGAGVCGHVDLGAWGGNHWDPGPNFPMDQVIAMAQGQTPPAPPTTKKGRELIASTSDGKGYWTTTSDGAVYAFGTAQHCGQPFPNTKLAAPIIGIAGCGTNGYWLLAADGGVFAYGSAPYKGRPDRT